jgi:hypothetical protein
MVQRAPVAPRVRTRRACELAGYVYSARSHGRREPVRRDHRDRQDAEAGRQVQARAAHQAEQRDASGKWLSDGVFEILLDGVVVFSDTAFKMRADPRATFQSFFVNIFHGGSNRR